MQRGELERPHVDDTHGDLIRRKGDEHEAAYLARLDAEGRSIVRIPTYDDEGFDADEARRLTEEAIRAGEAEVIYQPYLSDGTWRGFADFLERQPDGTYEAVDTKLARSAKPAHVLQLCFYSEQLGRIQGKLPERFHVELGSGERETFRTAEYMAYFRRTRERFLGALETEPETYPWPCDHCGLCDFRNLCKQQLRDDDNLVLVAGLRRSQAEDLAEHGIPTLAALGRPGSRARVDGMRTETLEGIRHQAELQLHFRETGEHRVDHLPDEEGRGFRLLPEPDFGDVWLDLEGHPFYEPARGLEYLFGWCYRDEDGTVRYEAAWARDRDGEREIFERFVDWMVERRRRYPGAHVYHYAAYERTALRRLMGEHGTREQEVDDFLRHDVLVDLYRVVKQALRASVESYSIKAIEALYGFVRTAEVMGGDESTVLFEKWLESGDDSLLRDIEAYNEEDCRSTVALHEWLLQRRPPNLPWRPTVHEPEPPEEEMPHERAVLRDALLDALAEEGDAPWLLAQLLDYHRREAKPQWWEWFLHLAARRGGADRGHGHDRRARARRRAGAGQELARLHVLVPRAGAQDLGRLGRSGDREDVHGDGRRRARAPHAPARRRTVPTSRCRARSFPGSRSTTRSSARRCRGSRARTSTATRRLAVRAVLERELAASAARPAAGRAVSTIEDSYLFVQGPPGSGKTWQGAKMAVALMRERQARRRHVAEPQGDPQAPPGDRAGGARAGLRLQGPEEVDRRQRGVALRGAVHRQRRRLARSARGRSPARRRHGVALRARGLRGLLDTLFVDEAGQVSLADAMAVGSVARNLVFLGDPNQLPQVSQGAQQEEAKVSVLQHLLGEHETVPPERGIFLEHTWRLRPEICAFTSEAYYEGRLLPAEVSARRTLAAGDGLVLDQPEHEGRSQSSWEEADAVAATIRALLGTTFTDDDVVRDARRRTTSSSSRRTTRRCDGCVSACPTAFASEPWTSSRGRRRRSCSSRWRARPPRTRRAGSAFAFNRHRVNVATSRAQCRVVLVCAPRLLDADCKTVADMQLVNAVCRFAELAGTAPERGSHRAS